MRRALLTASVKPPFIPPAIGDSFMGGYYAGIIDTTKGNIIAADYYQTGQRYALIVAPVSMENTSISYKTAATAAPASSSTRWNGLDATIAMNSSTYPAAQHCYGQTAPIDAASLWYLPAMDELELVYRNLKKGTDDNVVTTDTGSTFPGSQDTGYNPSSDPAAAKYTVSVPPQTAVAAFATGGAQSFGGTYYWSATEYSTTDSWSEYLTTNSNGFQRSYSKNFTRGVRPVRRLVLA